MLSALLRRTVLTVAIASLVFLALEGGFSVDVSGQHDGSPISLNRPLVTSTAFRTAGNATGHNVFTAGNLARIGGVLSQANSLLDLSGNPVSVSVELAADQPYPGHIDVYRTGSSMRYEYPIEYNELVPMVLFVDGGGTSLYTFWESDGGDRFPPNFERDAGLVNHHFEGLVALEFHGTRYSNAVYFLDICQWICVEPADDDLDSVVERINTELDGRPVDGDHPDVTYITYINTDVDLPFKVSEDGDLFSVDGNVARLHPYVSSGDRIVIRRAERIVASYEFEYQMRQKLGELAGRMSWFGDVALAFKILEEVAEVHFLFETLALLRSAKESSPDEWKSFRQVLESEFLVRANPEPWYRYSRSFCALYSDDDDCQN